MNRAGQPKMLIASGWEHCGGLMYSSIHPSICCLMYSTNIYWKVSMHRIFLSVSGYKGKENTSLTPCLVRRLGYKQTSIMKFNSKKIMGSIQINNMWTWESLIFPSLLSKKWLKIWSFVTTRKTSSMPIGHTHSLYLQIQRLGTLCT